MIWRNASFALLLLIISGCVTTYRSPDLENELISQSVDRYLVGPLKQPEITDQMWYERQLAIYNAQYQIQIRQIENQQQLWQLNQKYLSMIKPNLIWDLP